MKILPNTLWSSRPPPPSPLPSLLQLVASLGKQYIVWQEIFDNGLQVLFMERELKKPFHLSWCCPIFLIPIFTFDCYTSTQNPYSLLSSPCLLLLSHPSPSLPPLSSLHPPLSPSSLHPPPSSLHPPPLFPSLLFSLCLSHPPGPSRDSDWCLEGRWQLAVWGV